jgi:hypothetical protein
MVSGYQIVFYLQLRQVKSEMKSNINKLKSSEIISVFSFEQTKAAELEWKEDHEFRFNGELYDVIEKRFENGKLIIRCISDKNETKLIEDYKKNTEKNTPGNASLIQLLTSHFTSTNFYIPLIPQKDFKNFLCIYSFILTARTIDLLTPPPKFLLKRFI